MTKETKAIIKSTALVLKEHGEAKELFKNAQPNQYKKLSAAVYAYTANIDNLDALGKGIEKMVGAHVKTNIQPHHYPWVAEALLAAIKEVLGDKATKEVINAWAEAYTFLANVLIEKEKVAYVA